ncbi:mediator complex, subunit Med11 [Podospora conica]|nr:mediator complex, subunit Med11 [Schizothecium conicum]
MDPSFDPSNTGTPPNVHEPFSTAERIQQLSAVDKDISSLLHHTSIALRCIANLPGPAPDPEEPGSPPSPPSSAEDALANFKIAQSDFINTLDRIDKVLKRHIFALEEAGIITLRGGNLAEGAADGGPAGQQDGGAKDGPGAGGSSSSKGVVVARLDPDGMGRIGAYDVGHLNMASSAVERDMEGELWARTREVLVEEEKEKLGRMEE